MLVLYAIVCFCDSPEISSHIEQTYQLFLSRAAETIYLENLEFILYAVKSKKYFRMCYI